MKKVILAIAFIAVGVACKNEKKKEVKIEKAVEVETLVKKMGNVNVITSKVEWKGTKPTGAHNGIVNLSTGSLNVENGEIKGGEFVIDMESIKCLDIPENDGKNKDLVDHLNGDDFFAVKKYPTAKFVIASAEKSGDNVEITGNLTIKGKTKSITFPASFSQTDIGYSLKSEPFKIDRTQFDITYKSKTIDAALKDKFIDDLIEFVIVVNAKK